jgi:hypothetical protein
VRFEISKRTGCARSGPLVEFEGGGLISYLRGMGRLHTLNTSDGFPRKPRQLGVEFEAEATGCVRAADADLKSWTRMLEETNDIAEATLLLPAQGVSLMFSQTQAQEFPPAAGPSKCWMTTH